MNIIFTVSAHNFDKAASIENALKSIGLSYSVKVDEKRSNGSEKRTNRKQITKVELLAVIQCMDNHPSWTYDDVSKSTGVGRSVVGRISQGTHPLQRGGSDIEKDI